MARHGQRRCRPNSAALGETEARRRLRAVAEALQALQRIDYYPGAAAEQAQAALDALRAALDARFSRANRGPAPTTASRASISASSRASAGRRARGRGSTGWPAPG